jgi:hypothetical protein
MMDNTAYIWRANHQACCFEKAAAIIENGVNNDDWNDHAPDYPDVADILMDARDIMLARANEIRRAIKAREGK